MLSCALFVCVAFVSSAVQGAKREPFRLVMSMRALGSRSMSYELHSVPIDVGPRLTSLYGVAVPTDVTNHWRDVETVVFAGCAVLDIGDKGNHYSNPASHSASPGLKWAASSGASALLGYCWKAPLDNQGAVQILNSWCDQRASIGDIEAWMRANDRRSGHNACAIRRMDGTSIEYHYFAKRARLYWSRQIDTLQQGE